MSLPVRLARAALGLPVAVVTAVIAVPKLAQHVAELTRPGGAVDSLAAAVRALEKLDQLVAPLERLADLQDELEALGQLQDELDQLGKLEDELATIAGFGPLLARLTEVTQSLPDLSRSAENLPDLVIEVREVRSLVSHLDRSFDDLLPMLRDLNEFAGGLGDDVDGLNEALLPISSIAGRLPGARRARRQAEKARRDAEAEANAGSEQALPPGD